MQQWQSLIEMVDDRRDIIVLEDKEQAVHFSAEHFIHIATTSIETYGAFTVALSGGSTPKEIYKKVTSPPFRDRVDWTKVKLFWSDERAVPSDDPESNFHMAMESGFSSVPIPKSQIFRMPADDEGIEKAAEQYEEIVIENLVHGSFDLMMLGMGDDGHTASLFPKTHGLHTTPRKVIANFIPSKNCWRMSLTFECINESSHIAIYVLGKSKTVMMKRALFGPYTPDELPVQRVGTRTHKALWITDTSL